MGAATPSAPVLVGAPTDPAGPVRLAERAVADAHRLVRAVGGAAEPAGAAWTVLVPRRGPWTPSPACWRR